MIQTFIDMVALSLLKDFKLSETHVAELFEKYIAEVDNPYDRMILLDNNDVPHIRKYKSDICYRLDTITDDKLKEVLLDWVKEFYLT